MSKIMESYIINNTKYEDCELLYYNIMNIFIQQYNNKDVLISNKNLYKQTCIECMERILIINEKTKINLYPLISTIFDLYSIPSSNEEINILTLSWNCIGYSLLYNSTQLDDYYVFLNKLLDSLSTYPWKVVQSLLLILEKFMKVENNLYPSETIKHIFNELKELLEKFTKYTTLTMNSWKVIKTMVQNKSIIKEKNSWIEFITKYINDPNPEISKISTDCIELLSQ